MRGSNPTATRCVVRRRRDQARPDQARRDHAKRDRQRCDSVPTRTKKKPVARPASSRVRESPASYDTGPAVWHASDRPRRTTPLLLDTHVWCWVLKGEQGVMVSAARQLIDDAARHGRLFVSDISCWEVAVLVSKQRLELGEDVEDWLGHAVHTPGISVVPLTRAVLVRSIRLPGAPHPDPTDRMLMAQAQLLGASLVTCDRSIVTYARTVPGISVCDARALR